MEMDYWKLLESGMTTGAVIGGALMSVILFGRLTTSFFQPSSAKVPEFSLSKLNEIDDRVRTILTNTSRLHDIETRITALEERCDKINQRLDNLFDKMR